MTRLQNMEDCQSKHHRSHGKRYTRKVVLQRIYLLALKSRHPTHTLPLILLFLVKTNLCNKCQKLKPRRLSILHHPSEMSWNLLCLRELDTTSYTEELAI